MEEDICSESSWDPDEDDDKEVEDSLMNEVEKKRRVEMKLKNNRDFRKKYFQSQIDDDPYGYEDCDYDDEVMSDDYGGEEEAKLPKKKRSSLDEADESPNKEDEDDLQFDSDDAELSQREEEIEVLKYKASVRKTEQKAANRKTTIKVDPVKEGFHLFGGGHTPAGGVTAGGISAGG